MFWVYGRYALDILWVCGMYGSSGCGYVVVGISPGACDRLSVVVVVVDMFWVCGYMLWICCVGMWNVW